MSKKTILLFLAAVLTLALLCGCQASAALVPEATPEQTEIPETPKPIPDPTPEPVVLSIADPTEHPALMSVNEDGYYQAYKRVSRMEACIAIYRTLEGWQTGDYLFSDLNAGQEGYAEAAALCRAGLLPVESGESFSPNKLLTREELTDLLTLLAGGLNGEELARVEALITDVKSGALSRDGRAESVIARDEFAVILVQLTGRELNEAAFLIGGCLPEDVDTDSYAWMSISDVVTEEVPQVPEQGVYRVDGCLYAVGEDGRLLRDIDYGVWTFGPDGRYTTGSEELDEYIRLVLVACGTDDMTDEEALEAVYLHVKYSYQYLVTPEDMVTEEPGATGWENERALRFFRHGGGTCYGFAAAFGLLARSLGERAYVVSAQVNQYYAPHGFVVIPEGGVDWIYDVEMEATRQDRHEDLELFRIRNNGIYNYWYTPDW